jgi:flagellar assembly factor FliW
MQIDIERLGLTNVSVDPQTVFDFPQGLAGFEELKRFSVFHEEGKPTVFWLQSLDDTSLTFPIVAPESIDLEYRIELSDEDAALLETGDAAELAVVVIVYRSEADDGKIAANTRSPIILNLSARKGMQKILRELHSAVVVSGR